MSIAHPSSASPRSTLTRTSRSTCLPGLEGGRTRLDLQAGPIPAPSGPGRARAGRGALRGREEGRKTHATSGPTSSASSAPVRLQSCLESRLRDLVDVNGSPEFTLTWREQGIGARLRICALLARARPTCGKDTSGAPNGWPTPDAHGFGARDADRLVERRAECKERTGNGNGFGLTLGQQVCLITTGWPTPASRDHFPPHTPEYIQAKRALGHGMSNVNDAVSLILGWPTPTATTPSGGTALCKWGGTRSRERLREAVGDTVLNGALNPAFPCWLMGFPTEWIECAPSAMQFLHR